MTKSKQTAPVKIQADRWPLTEDENGHYIATIIVVAPFKGKPSQFQLSQMLLDAAKGIYEVQ